MECKLCGLATPASPLLMDGNAFCCYGCREVYRAFGPSILGAHESLTVKSDPNPCLRGSEAFIWVDGMHCTSCELLLKHVGLHAPGIISVDASYATSMLRIVYDPEQIEESELPALFTRSGYRVRLRGEAPREDDAKLEFLRMVSGFVLQGFVMMLYLAFNYPVHFNWADVSEFEPVSWLAFEVAPTIIMLITTLVMTYTGLPIFRGAWVGLRVSILNMDSLLSLAVLSAYAYSVVQWWQGSQDIYFDVVASIVAVVSVGRYFERKAKQAATRELSEVMQSWVPNVRVVRQGVERTLGIDELQPHDHVRVGAGDLVPIDGVIITGRVALDESLINGEAVPVRRVAGARIPGGARVVEGEAEVEIGENIESRIEELGRVLWKLQSSVSGPLGMADRFARLFVPVVLFLAVLVGSMFLVRGEGLQAATLAALATLIVSCPCTFGMAVPLSTAVGVSEALRHGIILSGADLFEKSPHPAVVALDKTGTLTMGRMTVTEVIGRQELIELAAAAERDSSHPVARAIAALDDKLVAEETVIHPGRGVVANVQGHSVAVGAKSLFGSIGWTVPEDLVQQVTTRATADMVISFVGWDGACLGAILTKDQSREEWQSLVARLKQHSRVVLLTGSEHSDGYREMVDAVYAGVPPEAKAAVIRQIATGGMVAMIGDGSNDAPALAAADLGIAFGAPTALACEAADIVIPGDDLEKVFVAFSIIEATRRRIRQNVGWALLYNAVLIPFAMMGFLNPGIAAISMSASSLLVVWNAARPLGINKQSSSLGNSERKTRMWGGLRTSW